MIRSTFNYDNAELKIPFLYKNNTAEPEPVNIRFLLNDATDTPKEIRYPFPMNNDQKFNLIVRGFMVHRFFELFSKPILLQSRFIEFRSIRELDIMPLWKLDDFRVHMLSNYVLKKVHLELDNTVAISSSAGESKSQIYAYPARNVGPYERLGAMDHHHISIFDNMTLDKFIDSYATAMAISVSHDVPSILNMVSSVPLYYYDYYSLNDISAYPLMNYDEQILESVDETIMDAFLFNENIDGMHLSEFNIYTEHYRTHNVNTYNDSLITDVDEMIMSDFILT